MINLKKIVGFYLMLGGAFLHTIVVADSVYDRVSLVDMRSDSVSSSFRNVADNTESTVIINSQYGAGSGFYISDHYVVTNAHVVSINLGVEVESPIVYTHDLDIQERGRLVAINRDLDLAIIWTPRKGSPVLTYNTKSVSVGDFIYSIGSNPRNLKSIKTGYVLKTDNNILPQTFITDSRLEPGFSGGATFDRNDILVGINVAGWGNYKDKYSFIIEYTKAKEWVLKTILRDRAEIK